MRPLRCQHSALPLSYTPTREGHVESSGGWRNPSKRHLRQLLELRRGETGRTCRPFASRGGFEDRRSTGNGGYVAGLVAAALGGSSCTVTLKSPPPLDRDLSLETKDASASSVRRWLDRGDGFQGAYRNRRSSSAEPGRGQGCRAALHRALAPHLPGLLRLRPGAELRRRDANLPRPSCTTAPVASRQPGRRTKRLPTNVVSSVRNSCGLPSTARAISRPKRRPDWLCSGGCLPSCIAPLAPGSR